MAKRLITLLGCLLLAFPAYAQLPGGGLSIGNTPVGGGVNGDCLNVTSGKLGQAVCGAGTAADITVGTTTVTGAANGDILTRAGGNLGKLTPGTGVATALGANVGSAGAFVTYNGDLGTPSAGVLTNATGLPVSTGISGLGTGVASALASAIIGGQSAIASAVAPTSWTPADASGAALSFTVNSASYAKAGRLCILEMSITYPTTVDGSAAKINGIPATCAASSASLGQAHGVTGPITGGAGIVGDIILATNSGTTTMQFFQGNGGSSNVTNTNLSAATIRATIILIGAP